MSGGTLEDRITEAGGPVRLLRGSRSGAYAFPMRSEYTNWRDEQRAWQTTAVLFDQSFHMTDIYFEGPDVPRLFSDIGVNTFRNFMIDEAEAQDGAEVTIVWGEVAVGARRPVVEQHAQTMIRATVSTHPLV
jgi:aminomethyltransferase folate-binding domain-containing protein